jgi:hypothetical protein
VQLVQAAQVGLALVAVQQRRAAHRVLFQRAVQLDERPARLEERGGGGVREAF